MNRLKLYIVSLMSAACLLNIGCVSTMSDGLNTAYYKTKSTLNKIGNKHGETDALYAQVREEDKQTINELNHDLEVTQERKVLATLQKKRDELQRDRSKIDDKRLQLLTQEKTHRVQLAKLEAIDRNQLGDKIKNIELIADTHVDALEVQQKRLQLDSDVSILDVKISKIETEIEKQQIKIDGLTGRG